MNRARNVVLLVLFCLVAPAAQAQEWRGSASIALEVKGKPRGNVPDALVILRYQQMEPPGGPRPVVTDAAGQAVLVDLAEGVWEVEVSHGDFLSFVALVMLESGRKPTVQASFLQASGSSLTPIRVKFMSGKGRAPSASVPLPPEAAARLAQRRPAQPLRAPSAPTTEPPGPARTTRREPQPVMPEPELRPLPGTAKPADTPSPPPLAEPTPAPGDIASPGAEVGPQPEPAPASPQQQPQPPQPETPSPSAPAAEPTPPEPVPQPEPTPPPPVTEPAAEPEPEAAPAAPEPPPTPVEPEPGSAAPPPAPPAPEPDSAPEMTEPEPAPPAPDPIPPQDPERAPPIAQPTSPPPPEPVPAPEPDAPEVPTPPAPEPIPAEPEPELEPEPEARVPEPEPLQPEPEPAPVAPPTAPEPTTALPPPGPLGPTLRAYGDRSCVECRPGEWAISVEAIAGPAAAPCSASLETDGRELAALLGSSVALELKEVAAPAPQALGQMASGDASARVAELLGDDSQACRIVAAVIPKAGRFRGLRMEAADASGIGDCQADRPCPVGRARWLGQPRVSREPSANVIWGLFVNEAPDRARRARLTVYFAAPNRAWDPPR